MTPISPSFSNWSLICQSVKSLAHSMGQSRSRIAADLIIDLAEFFCSQSPPQNNQELNQRMWQRDDLTGRFSFITYADEIAKRNPTISETVFKIVQQEMECPLATSDEDNDLSRRRRLEMTQSIARLDRCK